MEGKIQVRKSTHFIRAKNFAFIEGLNGVERQPSRTALKLTVNGKKRLFFTINRQKMQIKINCQMFQAGADLSISTDFHGVLAPEESLNWRNHFSCSQKHFL